MECLQQKPTLTGRACIPDFVLHEIGYWHEPGSGRLPADPARLVRPHWAGPLRGHIIDYVRTGHKLIGYMGSSFCRFGCGEPRARLGLWDLTDGVWLWPQGLAHYLDVHGLALPDAFLAHAAQNHFAFPARALARVQDIAHVQAHRSAELWERWVRENDGVHSPGAG
jgi:hypothetical protein